MSQGKALQFERLYGLSLAAVLCACGGSDPAPMRPAANATAGAGTDAPAAGTGAAGSGAAPARGGSGTGPSSAGTIAASGGRGEAGRLATAGRAGVSGAGASGAGKAGTGAAGSGTTPSGGGDGYGQKYEGGEFHLGPVDYDETVFHNACAPGSKYNADIRKLEGELLVGLWNGIQNTGQYCDACIQVTSQKGKTANLRVITYGDTTMNSIDLSPQAYDLLNSGEYPRWMTWQFAKCPDTGAIVYEFQSASNPYWTSLWVRNARVPISKLEVKGSNHDWQPLTRGGDGTLTDDSGFGEGKFSIRLTGVDGQTLTHDFDPPAGGLGSAMLKAPGNFP
jgi:hypothetical protein